MSTGTFKIVEITKTIQGEGYWTGLPVTLIRFQECNLNCSFCDTDRSKAKECSMEKLLKLSLRTHPNILLTGGEPFLAPAVIPLIEQLLSKGHWVQVETNGTFPDRMERAQRLGAWVTCSPKLELSEKVARACSELKLLVGTKEETKPLWKRVIKDKRVRLPGPTMFLQPVWGPNYQQNLQQALELCRRYPNLFRLSVQVHKYLRCP